MYFNSFSSKFSSEVHLYINNSLTHVDSGIHTSPHKNTPVVVGTLLRQHGHFIAAIPLCQLCLLMSLDAQRDLEVAKI